MKNKNNSGINKNEAAEILFERIKSGDRLERITLLKNTETPVEDLKKKKKLLNAEKNWIVRKNAVQYKSGMTLDCIASWGRRIVIHFNRRAFIGWVLYLDFGGLRSIYFVPLRHVDKLTELEGIDLNQQHRDLLIRMANSIGRPLDCNSWVFCLEHPALGELWENLPQWQERVLDRDALLDLLRREPWLWHVFLAEIPVHLRPLLKDPEALPLFAENLITETKEDREVLMQAIRAVTFVNATGLADIGTIWCGRGLQALDTSPERAVLINGTAAVARDVIAALEERDRILKCGSQISALPTVPVLLSGAYIFSDLAVNHVIPSGLVRLTDEEQDLLRTAMAHFLNKDKAKWVIREMDRLSSAPESYRSSRAWIWCCVLLCGLGYVWFPNGSKDVIISTQLQLKGENQKLDLERQEIEEAYEFLTHPDRYADLLLHLPETKQEAEEALKTSVGFVWTPSKGNILKLSKGKPLVTFRKHTLGRLFGWPVDDIRRLATLLSICEQRGNLLSSNQKVTFKDGSQLTMLAFSFSEEEGELGD